MIRAHEMSQLTPRSVGMTMVDRALAWLEACRADQLVDARGPGPDLSVDAVAGGAEDRRRWFYTPTDHGGLALAAQTPRQQQLCLRLVAAGLSETAFDTMSLVIGLENVLDRVEDWSADWGRERGRDPGLYWMRVFGSPEDRLWGWRFAGHHVSLNYVVEDGVLVSTTPSFLGADPAITPLLAGGRFGPLHATEELARRLYASLSDDLRARALLHPRAPSDIVSGNRPRVASGDEMLHMDDPALWHGTLGDPRLRDLAVLIDRRAESESGYLADDHRQVALWAPAGVTGAELDGGQRALLTELVGAYAGRSPLWTGHLPEAEIDAICFSWAGSRVEGEPNYHRLAGPDLLAEYDNTQRGANHVHSVWRAPASDFGGDALRTHLRRSHR